MRLYIRSVNKPVLSELHKIVSFSLVPGPCLIHTEIMKGSFRLTVTTPSGIFTACVPLNSKTWSLSWPLSVGSPIVQLAALLGGGRSSAVPEDAPTIKVLKWKEVETKKTCFKSSFWTKLFFWALVFQHSCQDCVLPSHIKQFSF